jgi:hypothetical protein
MREDPRRRFAFAFTVENRNLRLWFASRSEILVSESFDFISVCPFLALPLLKLMIILKEPVLLIRFFISVMYSQPHQLGWDTTMKVISGDGKHPRYDITVLDESTAEAVTFRTTRLISNISACSIRGRGTRVWEVRQLGPDGEPIGEPGVLKDSWPDADRTREATILGSIRNATPQQNFLHRALLTIMANGDVNIDGIIDQTMDQDTRLAVTRSPHGEPGKRFLLTQLDYSEKGIERRNRQDQSNQSQVKGSQLCAYSVSEVAQAVDVTYSPKIHSRVVFREVCKSLNEEKKLSTIFTALKDACGGMCTSFDKPSLSQPELDFPQCSSTSIKPDGSIAISAPEIS